MMPQVVRRPMMRARRQPQGVGRTGGAAVYKRILLTHDGSETASAAVPHAAQIAVASNAEVIVAQVIDSVQQVLSETTPATIEPMPAGRISAEIAEESVAAQREAAEENLAAVAEQLRQAGVERVSTAVLEGSAARAICDAAADLNAELIVISTHGRSGLGRVLLGSVADHVIRNSPNAAVLVVRPEPQEH